MTTASGRLESHRDRVVMLAVALVALVAPAIVACGPAATAAPSPTAIETGTRITYAVDGGEPGALDAVRELLAARAAGLGIDATVTAHEPGTVVVESRSPITSEQQRLLLALADLRIIPLPVDRFGTVTEPGPETLASGAPSPAGLAAILTSADVDPAGVTMTTDDGGGRAVSIGLAPAGAEALAAWSRAHVGELLAVAVNGHVVAVPAVMSPIEGGTVVITLAPDDGWPTAADLAAIRGASPAGTTVTVRAIEAIPSP